MASPDLCAVIRMRKVAEKASFLYCVPRMKERVLEVLKNVEMALKLHAGGIELVSCDEGTGEVVVRLLGTCVGCGLAGVTLKEGVEVALVREIPEVRSVRAVQ